MMTKKTSKPKPQPHDAGNGRFVKESYAKSHPKTTVFVTPKKH
nr:hypothetical protein [Bifidobacterium dentium]